MRKIFLPFLITGALALTGCSSTPLTFTPENIEISTEKINAELKSIHVSISDEDATTANLKKAGPKYVQTWKEALQDALDRSALFDDDASSKININAKLNSLDYPFAAATFHSKFITTYQIIKRKTGEVVYETTIESEGISSPGEDFLASHRLRHSINRAGQKNIIAFIERLKTVSPHINKHLEDDSYVIPKTAEELKFEETLRKQHEKQTVTSVHNDDVTN